MGITGTDVAKGAADMTLTDDNFATIVDAVREGRGIYANIRKVVGFLLGTNIGEVLTVFFAMILWRKTPLLSMQLLWINLVTDSLPAIALGMEAVEPDVMDHPPKPKSEGIFAHGLGLRIVLQGVMFALLSLLLIALVLFTPLRIVFELEALPGTLYLQGLGLALIPVLVMELSKKFGLIKHQH